MPKFLIVAIREFRATALTKAFLFGAVIFPLVIWAAMLGVSAMKFDRPALDGTLVVIDKTKDQLIAKSLESHFDPAFQAAKAKMEREQLDKLIEASEPGLSRTLEMSSDIAGLGKPANVKVQVLGAEADAAAQRERARAQEVLAVVIVDERTLSLDPQALLEVQKKRFEQQSKDDPSRRFEAAKKEAAGVGQADAKDAPNTPGVDDPLKPSEYAFVQGTNLRPDHADDLRRAIEEAVKDERYRRASINPMMARLLAALPVKDRSAVMTETGIKDSNEVLTRLLPFVFMMLIYIAAITGGQYLMMGTLEEKGSRVMEVLLSAVSARDLMIGKLLGQGLVGLTMLGIYSAVGMGIAGRFGAAAAIPPHLLVWLVIYFLMAYFFLGAMLLAVGSAVTEIREAQALTTPITIIIILPFMLMIPIMQNPGSTLARATSFFPPTTPYVMVMRLSQPSHVIPMWELLATTLVGAIGVVITVWAAAKIFRVGVLMYGKPPSLMGLLKWIRQA